MWTGRYTVGPQEYIDTVPGWSGRTGSTVRVSVLWRRSIVAPSHHSRPALRASAPATG